MEMLFFKERTLPLFNPDHLTFCFGVKMLVFFDAGEASKNDGKKFFMRRIPCFGF